MESLTNSPVIGTSQQDVLGRDHNGSAYLYMDYRKDCNSSATREGGSSPYVEVQYLCIVRKIEPSLQAFRHAQETLSFALTSVPGVLWTGQQVYSL